MTRTEAPRRNRLSAVVSSFGRAYVRNTGAGRHALPGGSFASVTDSSSDLDAYLDDVLIGGREPVEIVISEYDASWPARFESERQRLASALGDTAVMIEHIGSTAVPGLAAKPIIDILVTVTHVDPDDRYTPTLEEMGYVLRVREPGHRMFRTPARDVHIHVWPTAHEVVERYLVLRDWLRYDEASRLLYERRKRELAGRKWADTNHYAEAKSEVIVRILESGMWAKRQRHGPWAVSPPPGTLGSP
jgi:GrpB-like predicted nucleotidyltransferase (UPF0157 family)